MNTISPAMPYAPSPPNLAHAARIAGAVRLTSVQPISTRWLWPGRIPLGRVTLLVSDPGVGKSLLTLDIAARVSTGAEWPDQGMRVEDRGASKTSNLVPRSSPLAPSSVLLLTAEDDLADTVRPRLEALGANCEKILAIDTWCSLSETAKSESRRDSATGDVPRAFVLNRDLARLNHLLDAIPDCRLLVIDPISAYLGSTNEHGNADVRALLNALATLARERDLAVIVVSHLRKKEGAAIHRTMGSLAFVAAARAAWILCKDPRGLAHSAESSEQSRGLARFAESAEQNVPVPFPAPECSQRLLLPLKNNLAPTATGLAFTIETTSDGRTPIIHWSPDVLNMTVDTLADSIRPVGRPDDERQHAVQWLRERLANGPRATADLKVEAAAHAISYGTLRRAFRQLGGQAVRESPFPSAPWLWKLPGTDAQNPGGEFCAPVDFLDELTRSFSFPKPSPVPPAP